MSGIKLCTEVRVMYGMGSDFWLELLFILAIILLLLYSFNGIMSILLKVEKKSIFSNNYVNEKHSKIDKTVRITFVVLMIIGFLVNISRLPMEMIWFFETWFLLLMLSIGRELVRAVMEWKYEDNRNAYKVTIFQIFFIIILLIILYWTDFFWTV